MNFNIKPEQPKLDSGLVDQIKDSARRSTHHSVKRVYDKVIACIHCNKISVTANTVIGFCCRHCGKYQNAEAAVKNYLDGNGISPDDKSVSGFPNIISNDPSSNKVEYRKLRDEMEIRSDLFINGKTRDSLGLNTFSKTLKSELMKNKCYRGEQKAGV